MKHKQLLYHFKKLKFDFHTGTTTAIQDGGEPTLSEEGPGGGGPPLGCTVCAFNGGEEDESKHYGSNIVPSTVSTDN